MAQSESQILGRGNSSVSTASVSSNFLPIGGSSRYSRPPSMTGSDYDGGGVSRSFDSRPPSNGAQVHSLRSNGSSSFHERYIYVSTLGRGAQGEVYKCHDTFQNNKIVAIKSMNGASITRAKGRRLSARAVNNVISEIAILKKLNHPNLVKLYEVIDEPEENRLHLVLEYVDTDQPAMDGNQGLWGSMKRINKRSAFSDDALMNQKALPLKEEVARVLFRQLVIALEYLHNHDILHKDIKPSNILVAGDGTLKLTDFGISSTTSKEKSDRMLGNDDLLLADVHTVKGTPAFLPPELYDKLRMDDAEGKSPDPIMSDAKRYHGRPADIWATGMTLFAFVYGRLPFCHKGCMPSSDTIRTMPLKFPGTGMGVSSKLRNLLSRMLDKDPNTRATLGEIRLHPWVCAHGPLPELSETQRASFNLSEIDHKLAVRSVKRMLRSARSRAHILGSRVRVALQHSTSVGSHARRDSSCDDELFF